MKLPRRPKKLDTPVLFETDETTGAYTSLRPPLKRQPPATPPNRCAWPGCPELVARSFWGCTVHRYRLPSGILERIKATFAAFGPDSEHYASACAAAERWIHSDGGGPVEPPHVDVAQVVDNGQPVDGAVDPIAALWADVAARRERDRGEP